jgi:hypothetical protein
MGVKTDYRKGTLTILDDESSLYPLRCKVLDNSVHSGVLQISHTATKTVYISRETATELLYALERYVDTGKITGDKYRIGRLNGGFVVLQSLGEQAIDRVYRSRQVAKEICDALNKANKGEGE